MHWIFKVVIVLFSILLLGLVALRLAFLHPDVYEMGLKGQKYIALNLDKNWGVRKKMLKMMRSFSAIIPRQEKVLFNKDKDSTGVNDVSFVHPALELTNQEVRVRNSAELAQQLNRAVAGTTIILMPGQYNFSQKKIRLKNPGLPGKPIVVKAEKFGNVTINLDSLEGFYIDQPYWVFSNLIFNGICSEHYQCEHAMHIVGDADHLKIINNRFVDFNAHIKSNGERGKFPDKAQIFGNDFYNTTLRYTSAPITPIDIVGGDGWQIVDNFIADFARSGGGQQVTYGAFLKGAGTNGRIEGNLVNCNWKVPYNSILDIRIGLSLGGGGTNKSSCQDRSCEFEHQGGVINENILLNCSNDVAIYLNKASNAKVTNNILLNSLGIDVRYQISSASINGNLMHGRVKGRDGAVVSARENTILSFSEEVDLKQVMPN